MGQTPMFWWPSIVEKATKATTNSDMWLKKEERKHVIKSFLC